MDGVAEPAADHRCNLVAREREQSRVDVEDLALAAQTVDRERRLVPRSENQMKLGRRLSDEALEQEGGSSAGAELVHVVEDEHLVALRFFLQRLSEYGGKRFGPGAVLASVNASSPTSSSRASARPRAKEVRQRSAPSTRYQDQPRSIATERHSVDFPNPGPATIDVSRRRFRFLEQAFERGPAHVRGREPRRDELDAWSLQKLLGG